MPNLRRLRFATALACLVGVAPYFAAVPTARASRLKDAKPEAKSVKPVTNDAKADAKDVGYSVAVSPYIPSDFDELPVAVVSVTSTAFVDQGWRIAFVELEKHGSAAAATSVRLTAYVSSRANVGKVSHRIQTADLPLAAAQKTSSGRTKLFADLISQRDLQGFATDSENDFQVDVAVTAVSFADGTTWAAEETSSLKYMTPEQFAKKTDPEGASLYKKASYTTPAAAAYTCYATCQYHYVGGGGSCPEQCWRWVSGCEYCSFPCLNCPPHYICTCGSTNYYDCGTPNPSPTKCTIGGGGASCTVTYPCS